MSGSTTMQLLELCNTPQEDISTSPLVLSCSVAFLWRNRIDMMGVINNVQSIVLEFKKKN